VLPVTIKPVPSFVTNKRTLNRIPNDLFRNTRVAALVKIIFWVRTYLDCAPVKFRSKTEAYVLYK